MPPGEVDKPRSDEGFLKSGYLKRYDLYDDDGLPSKIPVINAQSLNAGDPVIFDVVQTTLTVGGNAYFIPVAVIREFVEEAEWEAEWDKAENEKDKIKIKPRSIILNVSGDEALKNNVKNKISQLRKIKPQKDLKTKSLKQL